MDIVTRESLLREQAVQDLLLFLKLYKRNEEANDIFELVSYIEGLEKKLDQAIGELSTIKEQLNELQELNSRKPLKQVLIDMSIKLEEGCENMKQQILTIKQEVKDKASEIVQNIKEKGEVALHKVSEFLGIREKLLGVKKSIEGNIEKADRAIDLIQASGRHVRQAVNHIHNAGKIIAGKEEVAPKEKGKISLEDVIKSPWMVNRAVYSSINKRVDACVEKIEQLGGRVAERGKEKAENYDNPTVHGASKEMQAAENSFFNSEAFETYMDRNRDLGGNGLLLSTAQINAKEVR